MESLLLLGEYVGIGKFPALANRPRISLLVSLVKMGQSTKNDIGGICVEWAEDIGVCKGVGKTSEIETRTKNAKRGCLLVFIVENGVWEEGSKLHDVLVGNVVRELRRV